MSKRTPEPWSAQTNFEGTFISGSDRSVVGKMMPDGPNKESDARRIVACVNACRGLPTDELEQKGLVAAVGTQLLEADQLRDELLAALEALLADMRLRAQLRGDVEGDGYVILDCGSGVLMKVDAAIAKAKGGAAAAVEGG